MSAPWKSIFSSHLNKLPAPEFALATVHNSSLGALPKVRTCISRGFWTELPENSKNMAPKNPHLYKSSCLVFTTDVRMEKVADLFGASSKATCKGSGGGANVEMLYWIKDAETQWRISGKAYVLCEEDVDSNDAVKGALLPRMHKDGDDDNWSWSKEIVAHYANLAPGMRGTFLHPPPGTQTGFSKDHIQEQAAKQDPKPSDKLGNLIEEVDDPKKRVNFRVVVIAPELVEQNNVCKDPNRQRRWRYILKDAEKEEWSIEELWP